MKFTVRTAFVAILSLGSLGCGWFGGAGTEAASDEADEAQPPVQVVDAGPAIVPDRPEATLALNLKVGERFPLVKTVVQTLEQSTPEGPIVSESRLRMQMVITVDRVDANGAKRLAVRYHRVGYGHDVAGERIEYDSARPPTPIPPAVQAYHGLVGHGFSFEIGPDNEIKELIGFKGFLEQCLRDVPPSRRNAVLAELEATQGEEGIANFVDDSIGLLPYDAKRKGRESVVRTGYQWQRSRQMARPVPILENTTYTLKAVTDDVAEIDLTGVITPSTTFGPSGQENVIVAVQNGQTFGTCTIRRDSGLPIKSRVERHFNMIVHTPKAETKIFLQRKRVLTTIETYQEQSGPSGSQPVIVPASGTRDTGGPERPVVVPADFSGN